MFGLRGCRLGGALLEFVHAAGGVHELLRAGVKGMAHVANADDDGLLGGARLDHVAAGATDFRVHIFRMNVRLHKKDDKTITVSPDDKREFLGKKQILFVRNIKILFVRLVNSAKTIFPLETNSTANTSNCAHRFSYTLGRKIESY